jgi:hypothetical protein
MSHSIPGKQLISFKHAAIIFTILIVSFLLFLAINTTDAIETCYLEVISPMIGFVSFLCLLYAARKSKIYGYQIYMAWLLISFAILLFVVGDVIWAFLDLILDMHPFPSFADIFYLLYYIFFIMGLFLMLRPLNTPDNIFKTILDGLIVIISTTLIFWYTILSVLLIAHSETTWAFSLSLYYIIRDFVILMVILNLCLRRAKKIGRNPLIFLAAALFVQFITDILFSYQYLNTNSYYNETIMGWIIMYILIGFAGVLQGKTALADTKKLAITSQPVKYRIISFPVIWISLSIFMFIWGYYNLSDSSFFIVQFKVGLFFVLLILRRVVYMDNNWRFRLKKL